MVLAPKTIAANEGYVKNLAFHADVQHILNIYEIFYVMRDDNRSIIGMVGLKRINGDTLEVKRLQVTAAYQGQGLGRMLMEKVIHHAKQCGAPRLRLDVSETQVKAHALYLAMGFLATHVEARTLGPDHEAFLSTFYNKKL